MAHPSDDFQEEIAWVVRTGRDVFNKPAFTPPAVAAARVQPYHRRLTDKDGMEFTSHDLVYTEAALVPDALVWLPGTDRTQLGQARTVRSVDIFKDGDGTESYRKAYL